MATGYGINLATYDVIYRSLFIFKKYELKRKVLHIHFWLNNEMINMI